MDQLLDRDRAAPAHPATVRGGPASSARASVMRSSEALGRAPEATAAPSGAEAEQLGSGAAVMVGLEAKELSET